MEDYPTTGPQVNENTLITDYWLDFMAARGDRESQSSNPLPALELQHRWKDLVRRINDLLSDQAKLRQVFETALPQTLTSAHTPLQFSKSLHSPTTSPTRGSARKPGKASTSSRRRTGPGLLSRGKSFVRNRLRDRVTSGVFTKLT